MENINQDKLRNFCFDVICDFVNPQNVEIEEDDKGNLSVVINKKSLDCCTPEFLLAEWECQVKGTIYEDVKLIIKGGK